MHRLYATVSLLVLATAVAWADPGAPPLPQAPTPQQLRFDRRSPVVVAVARVKDAVVNISSTRLVQVRFGLFDDDVFNRFFPDQNEPFRRTVRATSLGSGVVIHPAGYVLTNAHVVARASEITCTFSDKTSHDAKLISADPTHDLAVLKIEIDPKDAKPLPFVKMGRSDDLMIGETVIAIGNPLGYSHTVTTGVVSALGREIRLSDELTLDGLVQTDASINPGNSGGPLLNINSELIGVNTAIRGDAQNIGFAIPIDAARTELAWLLDFARVKDMLFGASLEEKQGELVASRIEAESPAAKAKLAVGDRIVAVDGTNVDSLLEFNVAMMRKSADESADLTVLRNGKRQVVTVKLPAAPKPDGNALLLAHFGMRARALDKETAQRLRLREGVGLVITSMSEKSKAFESGLRVGDVLLAVDKLAVNSTDNLGQAIKDIRPGQKVRMTFLRGPYQLLISLEAQ